MRELLRATILHARANPFRTEGAIEYQKDGGLLISDGRIAGCGDFAALREAHREVPVNDLRPGYLLPGFIDTHLHFPQVRIMGGLGHQLLDWLEHHALPEEARMADLAHATRVAQAFTHALVAHGTTTALVFGAHFAPATAALFAAAVATGLRLVSGMVLSDRHLRPELHQTPAAAYRESSELIRQFHGQGRLLYAVTPRFALSTSEAMLEVCQTLMAETPGLRFQSHLNENALEIATVARLFPWATDYLHVYERYGLCGSRSTLAHNVHPRTAELERLAASNTSIAHCPCSNAALGSGIFPMRRHVEAGVHFALGTDVGGGTGFGMPKEALQASLLQRLSPDGLLVDPERLLYLATLAGAEALGLAHLTGNFAEGKAADVVYLRPPSGSPLALSLELAGDPSRILGAIFTQAGPESIRQTRVDGEVIYQAETA